MESKLGEDILRIEREFKSCECEKMESQLSKKEKEIISIINQEVDGGWTAHDFQDILNRKIKELFQN